MSSRDEFPQSVRKAAWARADGICECGCGRPFDLNHPKSRPEYDHSLPDFLGGTNDLENCLCVRHDCHVTKTVSEDMPRIKKVRREDKRRMGHEARKQKIPGSKGTGMRKKMDGTVIRVSE